MDVTGSAPDTDITPDLKWAVLHLTRNSGPVMAGHGGDDARASAISIQGAVNVKFAASESATNWTFRFIQLVAHMESFARYFGRTSKDGFVSIDLASPPGVPQKFAYDFVLDSAPEIFGADVMPFTNLRAPAVMPKRNPRGDVVPGITLAMNTMDDHPSRRMTTAFKNKTTGAINYIAEALEQKLFLTAFVAREESTKKITTLGYVTWQAEWKAKYRWAGGRCLPYGQGGALKVDKPVQGAPSQASVMGHTGASMAAKITNPTTDANETANTITKNVAKALDAHPEWWNVEHGDKWPPSVPGNFWKG